MGISSFGDSFQAEASTSDLSIVGWSSWTSYISWSGSAGRQGNGGIVMSSATVYGITKVISLPASGSIPLQFGFNLEGTAPALMYNSTPGGLTLSIDSSIWELIIGLDTTNCLTINNDLNGAHGQTTGTNPVSDGNSHYIECAVLLNSSSGYVKVWVDGELDINYSGPTCSTLPTTINNFTLSPSNIAGAASAGAGAQLSDFYFDATGNLTLPLGPLYAQLYVPTSNGDTVQYTPSTGTNFSNVNTGFHGSAFNTDAGTGHEDIFHFGTIPDSPAAVPFVILSTYGQNSGSGTANYIPKVKTGSTTTAGSTSVWPVLSLKNIQQTFYNDATGAPWTTSTFNSSQFGYGD